MKKILITLPLFLIGCSYNSSVNLPLMRSNVEYNENCMEMRQFKVFQVFDGNHALAFEYNGDSLYAYNPVVLLTPMRGIDFYDDMLFSLPSEKCAVQDGTYKYETKDKRIKTVPRITYEYAYSTDSEEEKMKRFYEHMDDLRYECKLSLTGNKKNNTSANRKKCDCSVDFLIEDILAMKEKGTYSSGNDSQKQMEKKCGRLPNGFWD